MEISNSVLNRSWVSSVGGTQLWEIYDYVPTSVWGIPYQTAVVPIWESSKPALTVPDLADTVEQMLARRTSGIVTPLTGPSMRIYPVDPSTVVEAGQMLKSLQELAQKEVEMTKAQIKQRRQEIAQKNAIAKQEAEEFAKYKATKKEG